jgi:type IV pilus assembly protein PilY1
LINTLDDMEGSGAPDTSPDNQFFDLDLGEQTVGLRFQNVFVDQGAVITSAYIEFVAVDSDSTTTNLTIEGEANDNAAPFSGASPVTSRTGTTNTVAWNSIPAWTNGTHYNSPDISSIVQEIVDRSGWSNGNAMVFRITGSGERDANSRDNSSTLMPILHIVSDTTQGKVYYGYFNPDYFYEYGSGIFTPAYKKESYSANSWTVRAFDSATETLSASTTSLSSASIEAGLWDGNWLNWLSMRRVDVLRKVMVGGLSHTRGSGGKQTVNGEDPENWAWFNDWNKSFNSTGNMPACPYHGDYSYEIEDDGNIYVDGDVYDVEVQKEPAIEPQDFDSSGKELVGVLQRIGAKARWGNTWYNRGDWDRSGGTVENSIDGSSIEDLVLDLQNRRCTTSTPLAETLYTVTQYFKQENVQGGLGYPSDVLPSPVSLGGVNDPYYDATAMEMVPCAKSFVILLTDGGSTSDSRIPNGLKDYDNDGNDASGCSDCSTNYLDDVAYYARTQDLRPDLDGNQHLNLYTIFAFAEDATARSLLMDAARNGGFIDRNENNEPDGDYTSPAEDRLEWDKDGDAIPDTYFEASDGYAMEARLLAAITDILKQAASGTAASVLSTNNQGAGNSVQAYFRPLVQKDFEEAKWYGFMQSLWVDPWGNLREESTGPDTPGTYSLNLYNSSNTNTAGAEVDKIVEFFFDEDNSKTKIRRYTAHYLYNPSHGDKDTCEAPPQDCTTSSEILAMDPLDAVDATGAILDTINPIFEAGERLSIKNPDDRNIYTYLDKDQNGTVDSGEEVEFTTGNSSSLTPYLGVRDGTTWGDSGVKLGTSHADRVNNLIEWTRGTDISGLRDRTLDGTTWRLGDIISSTPMMVGMPQEFYHELYGDLDYLDFIKSAKTRETVIYTGANDGMLHAFTSWKSTKDADGNLSYVQPSGTSEDIGDELWAYIPQSVLPHLKWNAMTDYTHTYFVDGPVRVFDAKILPNGTHYNDTDGDPNFGTFLVFGLGLGGKNITVNEDFGSGTLTERTFSPSYVMMDVTDPRNPKLMWERTYAELGHTTSPPAPVHIGSRKGSGKWYLVFGSGPTDYDGLSTQNGHVFVVDMATGEPVGSGGNDWIATSSQLSYFNEPLVLDLFQSHNADAIFMANNYLNGGEWESDVWKIAVPCTKCEWDVDGDGNPKFDVLKDELEYQADPTQWVVDQDFFHADGPVTAQLTSTVDPLDNLLLYFGTGRFISEDDRQDASRQYLYGVKDPFFNKEKYDGSAYHSYASASALPLDASDLLASDTIESVTTATAGSYVTGYGAGTMPFLEFVEKVRKDENGWSLSLLESTTDPSERIITQSAILGGIVLTPTFTPTTEICGMGGDTTFVGVFYETGTGYTEQLFDIETLRYTTVGGDPAEIIEIRDDDFYKGMPAPKAVFHGGKESGAKISTQVGTGEFVNIQVDPAYYFKSMIAEWWDDPNQAPTIINNTCIDW